MCRLFGMSAAPDRVRATFWLLDAPDSLAVESRHEPDGVGLGVFDADGTPRVFKQPDAAYADAQFATEARDLMAATFIAHIRYATTGAPQATNTHPFCQQNRLMAHNGMIGDLPHLETELGDAMRWVHGDTDSERLFALITKHAQTTGDLDTAITTAVRWIATNLPVYSLNLILTTPTELWALRYPDTHSLLVLRRAAGGPDHRRHLDHAGTEGTIRVHSADLATGPSIIVASERMDDDPGWRTMTSGELLHVGPGQQTRSSIIIDTPPMHPMTLDPNTIRPTDRRPPA